MDDVIKKIKQASDVELSAIIMEVIDRYGVVNPDWEVFFLPLPKNDPKERKRCVRAVASMLLHENHRKPNCRGEF